MKKYYDALLYTFTFILIQVMASVIVNIAIKMAHGTNADNEKMMLIIASSALSGVAATLLFWKLGWCKMSINYLRSKPFGTLFLTFILSLMIVIPTGTIEEFIPDK